MSVFRTFLRVFVAFLREIGDENAYKRYLATHNRLHSGAEWRRFSTARQEARFTRPKCC